MLTNLFQAGDVFQWSFMYIKIKAWFSITQKMQITLFKWQSSEQGCKGTKGVIQSPGKSGGRYPVIMLDSESN